MAESPPESHPEHDSPEVTPWAVIAFGAVAVLAPFAGHVTFSLLTGAAVLLCAIYSLRRFQSIDRRMAPYLFAAAWGLLAACLWKGIEEPSWMGLLFAYAAAPVALLAASHGKNARRETSLPPLLILAAAISLAGLALSMSILPLWLSKLFISRHDVAMHTGRGLADAWLLLAMMGTAPLLVQRGSFDGMRMRRTLSVGLVMILLVGASQAGSIAFGWFRASSAEREVGRARESLGLYARTLRDWRRFGLADSGSWLDAALRCRSAMTALDSDQPFRALVTFPPRGYGAGPWSELAVRTWNGRCLAMLAHSRCLSAPKPPGLYVDMELLERDGGLETYALDLWGRIWRLETALVRLVWRPDALLPGTARDFERLGDAWIVLAEDGTLLTSKPVPWLDGIQLRRPARGQRAVDFEILPSQNGAVIATDFGEVYGAGEMPAALPLLDKPMFPTRIVTDMELDADGEAYYLLDAHGAIHAQGEPDLPYSKPQVPGAPYWEDPIAIDLERIPAREGFYITLLDGEVFPVMAKPHRYVYRPEPKHPNGAVDLCVTAEDVPVILLANGAAETMP